MRDLTRQHLRELLACDAVGVKHVPESLNHIGPQVYSAAHDPVLDGLHRLNDFAQDSESLAPEGELGALQIGHFQPQLTHQAVIHERSGRC